MSGRRSSTRRALIAAAEGRRRSVAPYALKYLAPRGGSAHTPPPAADLLPLWPPSQFGRDYVVCTIVKMLVGPSHMSQYYGAVPEPEAKRAAANIEAEAHAAVSESAAFGATTLASSDAERFESYRTYCKEFCSRLLEFFKSRAAAGAAAALGGVRELGDSSATAVLPLAASASEEQG